MTRSAPREVTLFVSDPVVGPHFEKVVGGGMDQAVRGQAGARGPTKILSSLSRGNPSLDVV
jgi:hypothetical protein